MRFIYLFIFLHITIINSDINVDNERLKFQVRVTLVTSIKPPMNSDKIKLHSNSSASIR